jgi:uncharacterized protein (DUF362 family)
LPNKPNDNPSSTQIEVLEEIMRLTKELGREPSVREVGPGRYDTIQRLRDKGLLDGMSVTPKGRRWL